jgi:hypothetical protein
MDIYLKRSKTTMKDNIKKAKELNNIYTWDRGVAPERDKSSNPYYVGTNAYEIPIGTKDPVLYFKDWLSKYWAPNATKSN